MSSRERIGVLSFVFAVGMALTGWCDEGAGGALPFSRYGVGARALGMGGAFSGLADDVTAAVWNPAGLAQISGLEIGSQYAFLSLDRQFSYLSAVYGAPGVGTAGFSYVYFSPGPIEARSGNTLDPDGIFTDREGMALISFGTAVSESWSVGGNVKFYSQRFSGYPGTFAGGGFGIDFGMLFHHSATWSSGVVLLDPFSTIGWANGYKDTFPVTLRAGTWKTLYQGETHRLSGGLDLEVDSWLQMPREHVGLEYAWKGALYARAGLFYVTPTFGLGVRQNFSFFTGRLDYALSTDRIDGLVGRLSAIVTF